MSRPPVQPARELILPIFTQWERVGSITEILAELTIGWFYNAALLMDQAWRDDRVRSAYGLRVGTALGLPWHMEPADESDEAQTIADEAKRLWPKMAPVEELLELMFWGDHLGVGLARKEWITEDTVLTEDEDPDVVGEWIPTLKAWHAGGMRFDLMSDTYMLRTYDQGEIPIKRGDPNWTLYTPWGFKYGRLRGLLVSLAMLWLDRQWTFRDRARHGEVFGQPTRQVITPLDADQRDKDAARRAAANGGTESVFVTPQGKDEGWDLKLVEAMSNASVVFGPHLDHVDRAISILYCGQSESMQGKAGLGAQDKAGDQVMRYVLGFVSGCVGNIAADLLGDWAQYNFGDRRKAPKFIIEVDPPEDGAQKATEYKTLGDAADELEQRGVNVRKLLEEAGAPMMTPEEEKAAQAQRQERMKQQAELMGPQKQPQPPTDGKKPPQAPPAK